MAGRSQLPVQIMENQTRFDLNAAVENWRNELVVQPNLASDDRRELETHLRDAIAGFQQRGLNDEESFWLARKRVGQPQQIGEEFVKANPAKVWRERVFWIVASIVILPILGSVIHCLFAILTISLRPDYRFQGLLYVVQMLFNTLPVVYIITMIASGRMVGLIHKLSLIFHSQARLGSVAVVLVVVSSLIGSFGNWLEFRTSFPNAWRGLPMFDVTTLLNMVHPLIFVGLLVWLMPTQNRKTPKHA
jgi:hypothetical protein